MQSSTRKVAGSVRGKRLHSILIAGQIALTLLLLTAAGIAIQGFVRMLHVSLGYNPHNVMSVGIPVHEHTFSTWAERSRLLHAAARQDRDPARCHVNRHFNQRYPSGQRVEPAL
jgi:hypothetical protein